MILEKLYNSCNWKIFQYEENYKILKKNLEFLKEYLNLNTLEIEILRSEFNGDIEKVQGSLTSRQVQCIELVNKSIQEYDIRRAYEELYNFIESYNDLNEIPLNIIEKIFIKSAIIQIERVLEKELELRLMRLNFL